MKKMKMLMKKASQQMMQTVLNIMKFKIKAVLKYIFSH